MTKSIVAALAAYFCVSVSIASAPPSEIRYSFVDVTGSTGEVEVGNIDIDATGLSLSGSLGIAENIALFGGYSQGEFKTSDLGPFPDIDFRTLTLGVNPHFEIADNVDVVIPVAFEWVEADDQFDTETETGYSIGLGIRALPVPAVEISVGIQHVDIEDDDQFLSGSVRWHITDLFSLAGGAAVGSDSRELLLNGRFTF